MQPEAVSVLGAGAPRQASRPRSASLIPKTGSCPASLKQSEGAEEPLFLTFHYVSEQDTRDLLAAVDAPAFLSWAGQSPPVCEESGAAEVQAAKGRKESRASQPRLGGPNPLMAFVAEKLNVSGILRRLGASPFNASTENPDANSPSRPSTLHAAQPPSALPEKTGERPAVGGECEAPPAPAESDSRGVRTPQTRPGSASHEEAAAEALCERGQRRLEKAASTRTSLAGKEAGQANSQQPASALASLSGDNGGDGAARHAWGDVLLDSPTENTDRQTGTANCDSGEGASALRLPRPSGGRGSEGTGRRRPFAAETEGTAGLPAGGLRRSERYALQWQIVGDLFFNALAFCHEEQFSVAATSTFLGILKKVLEDSMCERLSAMESFKAFRGLLLKYSVQRPPMSIKVFEIRALQTAMAYAVETFYRHYQLYVHCFVPRTYLVFRQSTVPFLLRGLRAEAAAASMTSDYPFGKRDTETNATETTFRDAAPALSAVQRDWTWTQLLCGEEGETESLP
ncbi:hypothetical protein BESB_068870 [Besnoitia besnoiti]|uniref:Uncharacterized protein n=1 Tax=Besnoitia besnoiti TaxID=94643 RepID=A0A2A9MCA4_BESBE|nr:hypothetical protein BESB_068870 [Besnoitia besnoiti]PFH34854.1 hypothetical protein BESB_068870 [Besnoitia besnoiti]